MTWLKALAQRDLRALIALAASIGGGIAMTAFAVWITWILWRGEWGAGTELARIDKLGLALILVISISGITLASYGLAINKRTLKLGRDGFEASGGDDAPAAAHAVADERGRRQPELVEEPVVDRGVARERVATRRPRRRAEAQQVEREHLVVTRQERDHVPPDHV